MTNLDVKFSKYLQFDAEIITSKVINSLFVNREFKKLLQNTEIENNWLLLTCEHDGSVRIHVHVYYLDVNVTPVKRVQT